jgi:DNA-binding PadR family transcriptional regulator
MGAHPRAWVYLDTLARAARLPQESLKIKLQALEREGLVTSERVPAGTTYRLTDEGRRLRAG